MGLNTENLFVRTEASDEVMGAVEDYLRGPPSMLHPEWPLEITFDQLTVTRSRRVSISDSRRGWVAVVDSSETVDPRLAVFLSTRLSTRVAIAQVYEVTGSAGFALVENGIARGAPTRSDIGDPFGAITDELAKEGIPFAPVLFRATVGKRVVGWRTISRIPTA